VGEAKYSECVAEDDVACAIGTSITCSYTPDVSPFVAYSVIFNGTEACDDLGAIQTWYGFYTELGMCANGPEGGASVMVDYEFNDSLAWEVFGSPDCSTDAVVDYEFDWGCVDNEDNTSSVTSGDAPQAYTVQTWFSTDDCEAGTEIYQVGEAKYSECVAEDDVACATGTSITCSYTPDPSPFVAYSIIFNGTETCEGAIQTWYGFYTEPGMCANGPEGGASVLAECEPTELHWNVYGADECEADDSIDELHYDLGCAVVTNADFDLSSLTSCPETTTNAAGNETTTTMTSTSAAVAAPAVGILAALSAVFFL